MALFAFYAAAQRLALYNSDPSHVWNRVHRVLHVRVSEDGREYGSDELDPPLWPETKYLISGKSHQQAVAILAEFLEKHAERLISDPVRRAVFQHDLWTVFDWADQPMAGPRALAEHRDLQVRLAQIIRRVALNRREIERLPDNLAEAAQARLSPNLPSDLFKSAGPWVCVYTRGRDLVAPIHTDFFSQSVFFVFLRLPGGREETLNYMKRLDEYSDPWAAKRYSAEGPFFGIENPELPEFPPGTRTALVRQMMLLDQDGEIVPTHLTEAVQIRLYKTVPSDTQNPGEQVVSEFRMSREKLFERKAGGLNAIGSDEKKFSVFMTQGNDPIETPHPYQVFQPVLESCTSCHQGSGIHSIRSYIQTFGILQALGPLEHPGLFEGEPADLAGATVLWKEQRHDLGLLQGLWSR